MTGPLPDSTTPFALIGGDARVRALVDRFYDLVEAEPRYAALRAMHGADLSAVRESLTGFLTGWLGGPRDWFMAEGGRCIMSAHGGLGVSSATAGQWLHAMVRAMEDADVPPPVAGRMRQSFSRMAAAMIGAG